MSQLLALFQQHKSQKCQPETQHYAECYERHINYCDLHRMLEIGVAQGGSIRAWLDWTVTTQVHGLDKKNSLDAPIENARCHLDYGDQADREFIERTYGNIGLFDLVIDDGGHHQKAQQKTFSFLWRRVAPGGWYVIEDLHCSYWPVKGGSYDTTNTTIGFLKGCVDAVNHYGYLHERAEAQRIKRSPNYLERTLGEVHVYPSIAFLRRRAA